MDAAKIIDGYTIYGCTCGRDVYGVFNCDCGYCVPNGKRGVIILESAEIKSPNIWQRLKLIWMK